MSNEKVLVKNVTSFRVRNNVEYIAFVKLEDIGTFVEELKAEILGEYVSNEEEGKLNDLIDLAMMLGAAYVYRDSIVTPKVKTEEV